MDAITHDDLMEAVSTTGKVVGYALGALFSGALLSPEDRLLALKESLGQLIQTERFNPVATIVLGGLLHGITAHEKSDPDPDLEDEIL